MGITFKSSVFFLYMTRTIKNSGNSFLWITIVGYILWIPSSSLSQSHSIPANILTFFPNIQLVNLSDYTPSQMICVIHSLLDHLTFRAHVIMDYSSVYAKPWEHSNHRLILELCCHSFMRHKMGWQYTMPLTVPLRTTRMGLRYHNP